MMITSHITLLPNSETTEIQIQQLIYLLSILMVQDSTIQPPIFPQSTLVEQFSSILMMMITSSLTRFYNPTTDLSTIYTGGTVFFNIDDDDYFFFDIDFSTDTSDTSRTSRDTSNTSRFSSNDSSSDASVMTASILLLIVAALF